MQTAADISITQTAAKEFYPLTAAEVYSAAVCGYILSAAVGVKYSAAVRGNNTVCGCRRYNYVKIKLVVINFLKKCQLRFRKEKDFKKNLKSKN